MVYAYSPEPRRLACGSSQEKKRNYYLLTLKEERQINLKKFRKEYGTRPLSFASSEDLMRILRILPGSVTPLGLVNDE